MRGRDGCPGQKPAFNGQGTRNGTIASCNCCSTVMQSLSWFSTYMEVEMLQLTRWLPLFSFRPERQSFPRTHGGPSQWVTALWRSACQHAERPERVVPYC